MLSIRLDKEVEKTIDEVVAKMHITRSAFLRKAILEYLEDTEDYLAAEEALEEMRQLEARGEKSFYTEEEMRKKYKDIFEEIEKDALQNKNPS